MWVKRKQTITVISALVFILPVFFCFASGKDYSYSPEDRDPFLPLVNSYGKIIIRKKVDISGMSLEGIIYSRQNPVAVINGEVFEEEGTIGKYTVIKISESEVTLKKGGKTHTLKLEVEQ